MTFYLDPEDSPFDTPKKTSQYYQRVASALLSADGRDTVALAVCLPSFRPEFAIRLHGTIQSGYTITTTQAITSIYECNSSVLPTSEHRLGVSAEFAGLLTAAIERALFTVSNTNKRRIGLDGVSYHFTVRSPANGRLSGKVWSPRSFTLAGRLVNLVEILHGCVTGEGSGSCMEMLAKELHGFISTPHHSRDASHLSVVSQRTDTLAKLFSAGVLTADEVASELSDAWVDCGLPKPADVLRLIGEIPPDVRERMR